jgi:hypothetical protein
MCIAARIADDEQEIDMAQDLDEGRVQFGQAPAQGARDETSAGRCEVCGNEYALAFRVIAAGRTHVFDSFECAIHQLAPLCEHCGCRVLGHGVEASGRFFCCAHCARQAGFPGPVDNA